jgi:ABC-2 type transport system permease protein
MTTALPATTSTHLMTATTTGTGTGRSTWTGRDGATGRTGAPGERGGAASRRGDGGGALAMIGRSLRRLPRQPDSMITSVALPVMLLLLFVYVFGGAISDGRHEYLNYVVPGIIILTAAWGAASTAVTVCSDMVNGIMDRFRSMPIRGSAVLTGHVVASVASNVVSTVLVIGIALAIGFRPSAGVAGWLGAVGVLVLFVVALSWVAVALGLLARSVEAANGLTFAILFLPYVSSGFVPTDTMPTGLRVFAEHQPITPVIETVRGLLTGSPDGSDAVLAIGWLLGLLAAGYVAATILFRRRAAA